MKKYRVKHAFAGTAFDFFNNVLLAVFTFICIYPFYYIFIYSISDPKLAGNKVYFYPLGISFETYLQIFRYNNIANAFFVSASKTVLATALCVVCSSMLAFLLTKKEMLLRKAVYRYLIATMYFNAGLIPWYLTMKMYGFKDSFLLYVVPAAISPFFVILVKTYIEQLPISLQESAEIDGAGFFALFFKVILPLSRPIVATIAIFGAVYHWNSWLDNYFLVTNENLQTIQLILYRYLTDSSAMAYMNASQIRDTGLKHVVITPESVKMTITVISILPIVLVYPIMQKHFIKGIMIGAIKG